MSMFKVPAFPALAFRCRLVSERWRVWLWLLSSWQHILTMVKLESLDLSSLPNEMLISCLVMPSKVFNKQLAEIRCIFTCVNGSTISKFYWSSIFQFYKVVRLLYNHCRNVIRSFGGRWNYPEYLCYCLAKGVRRWDGNGCLYFWG